MIKKKTNKIMSLFKLINEFEEWKKKHNVENVFSLFEDRYYKIISKQDRILKELEEIKQKLDENSR